MGDDEGGQIHAGSDLDGAIQIGTRRAPALGEAKPTRDLEQQETDEDRLDPCGPIDGAADLHDPGVNRWSQQPRQVVG
jgi:hypothetical protein